MSTINKRLCKAWKFPSLLACLFIKGQPRPQGAFPWLWGRGQSQGKAPWGRGCDKSFVEFQQ